MAVISQSLSVPAGLATGQIAQASQILPLYTAMNAFVIPDSIGVFQQAFVDDTLYSLNIGATVTKDWTLTTVPQLKAMLVMIPFDWSGGNAPTLTYRLNGSAVTAAQATTAAATGNGMILAWIGGRTADVPRPMFLLQTDDGATNRFVFPNTNLPVADLTSFGITLGGVDGDFDFKHVRFWREG